MSMSSTKIEQKSFKNILEGYLEATLNLKLSMVPEKFLSNVGMSDWRSIFPILSFLFAFSDYPPISWRKDHIKGKKHSREIVKIYKF